MSKHFVCGQYEAAYYAPKNANWDAKSHLNPASTTPVTGDSYRNKPVTKALVNDQGHLINRKVRSAGVFGISLVQSG